VEPGEAAFDDPAGSAQAGTVGDTAAGEARGDAAGAQDPPVLVVVVAAASRVMSLRLPPVSVIASGMPPASQIR
jgi:hypothetical protein